MTKEVTSAKVAAIAGRVLRKIGARKCFGSVTSFGWRGEDCYRIDVCTVDELKAVCASALTQRPDKKARKR